VVDEVDVFADAGQHLAGCDGGVEGLGELGVPFGVVGIEGFLDPHEIELFQRAAHPHDCRPVPLLVGVHVPAGTGTTSSGAILNRRAARWFDSRDRGDGRRRWITIRR
jgi:hypothetical protein